MYREMSEYIKVDKKSLNELRDLISKFDENAFEISKKQNVKSTKKGRRGMKMTRKSRKK